MYRLRKCWNVVLVAAAITAALLFCADKGSCIGSDRGGIQQDSSGNEVRASADHEFVELIGRWINGPCNAIALDGETFYFGNGYSVEVFHADSPRHFSRIGKVALPGIPRDIAINGNYAYVTWNSMGWYDGMSVIDISDPSNPIVVAYYSPGRVLRGLVIRGDHAFVAGGYYGLLVIDITDPTNPTWVASVKTNSDAYNVALSGNHAYIAEREDDIHHSGHLTIVDVTNPVNPVLVGEHWTYGDAMDVAVVHDRAYVATKFLQIFDVSDPSNPIEIGSDRTPEQANSIEVLSGYAFVTKSGTQDGFCVIDISDPDNLSEVGFHEIFGDPQRLIITGDNAFIANTSIGPLMLDVSTPSAPSEIWHHVAGYASKDIALSGNYAYIAGRSELRLFDVSAPSDPVIAYNYYVGEWVDNVAINGDYAYLLNPEGMRVIDISDPGNLTETGSIETPGDALDITVVGSYAYVADGSAGLRIIDISDPNNPKEVGFYDKVSCEYVSVSGDFAYVTRGHGGLHVIDVSDKYNPFEVRSINPGTQLLGVFARGNYAYVAGYNAGLLVFDVRDPSQPVEIGRSGYPSQALDVIVSGYLAYVADGIYGLRVIDVSDPFNPTVVGYYDTDDYAWGVACSEDNCIYILDYHSGLYIFYTPLLAVLVQSFDVAIDNGSLLLTWELSEPAAISDLGIERRSIPSGPYLPIDNPEIRREGLHYKYRDPDCQPGVSYQYRVEIAEGDERRLLFETDPVSTPPLALTLFQNHPNPFNPATTIRFHLPRKEHVRLEVYDVQGCLITQLIDGERDPGIHEVRWLGTTGSGEPVSSGIYFYRLTAGKETLSRKMILLR